MTWKEHIDKESEKDYFKAIKTTVATARKEKMIHPKTEKLFNCFKIVPLEQTRVIIFGTEPYAAVAYNDGLAWSTSHPDAPAPLKRIFDEVIDDWSPNFRGHRNKAIKTNSLFSWAEQGVLLMNIIMTVEDGKPGSHRNTGWQTFAQNTAKMLSDNKEHLVFMLWGKEPAKLKPFIDEKKHLIIESSHPLPKGGINTFKGSKPFTQCNTYLNKHFFNIKPAINWFIFPNQI